MLNKHLVNALLLSLGFFGIFVAFSTTQNLESSLVPGKLGYWSLATLYIAFCIFALLFSAPISNYLQPKTCLIIGGISYLPLIATNLFPRWGSMIPAAAVLGAGASVLWAAQGTYITAAAANYARSYGLPQKSAMGLFNGLFFGIFQTTQIVGNIIASIILMFGGKNKSEATDILFYTFLGIGGFGVAVFLLLGKEETEYVPPPRSSKFEDPIIIENFKGNDNIINKMGQVIKLLKDPKMSLLVIIIAYSGMEQSFVFGNFTGTIIKTVKGTEWIGFIISVFGVCDAIGSVVLGKLADKYGKTLLVYIGTTVHVAIFVFFEIYFWKYEPTDNYKLFDDHFYILFILAGLFGIADSCWVPFGPIMMSVFFTDNTEAAFSNLKFWQSMGAAAVFIYSPMVSFQVNVLILGGVLLAGVASVMFLHFKIASINSYKTDLVESDIDHNTSENSYITSNRETVVSTYGEEDPVQIN